MTDLDHEFNSSSKFECHYSNLAEQIAGWSDE